MKAFVPRALVCALAAAGVALAGAPSHADSGSRTPPDPVFLAECGSCHVPYPARLLSAASWRTVMNNLDHHFGTDASIDAATAATIRGYLETSAGAGGKVSADPALVRVTQSPRFLRKHDEIPASVFRSEKVKGAANCGACHASAPDGRFSDHDAHIPR